MDKKNWILVAACLAGVFAYPVLINYIYPPPPPREQAAPLPASGVSTPGLAPASASPSVLSPATVSPAQKNPPVVRAPEQLAFLENDYFKAEFTTHGGGIKTVALKKHTAEEANPIILNQAGPLPLFNLRGWGMEDGAGDYQIESQTAQQVTLVRALSPTLRLQRTYTVTADYGMELSQTVFNQGASLEVLNPYQLDLGSVTPIYGHSAERPMIGLSWQDMTGSYSTHKLAEFDPAVIPLTGIQLWSGKSVIESKPEQPLNWAAIKSQFFVVLVNPVDLPITRVEGVKRLYPELREKNQAIPDGIVASLTIPGVQVEPGSGFTQKFNLYAGPRENSRLVAMSEGEAEVMEFGLFGWVSRFLLWTMNYIHDVVKSYGWAIVVLTIFLKALLWMPQNMANLSMRRMAAVAPVIKEVQEKYKDKPEKLNTEMVNVYKDYGVNPVGGCLPLLLQFPIFLGFYSMLQTAIELRHQSFWWIQDLSQADTVLTLPLFGFDFPINPMPLIMAGTMYWSMHVTPQPAGVDNPMLKVMKFMPIMFLAFCYNFSAALSLYWTVQNLLSIVQLYYNTHFQKEITLEEMKAQVALKKRVQKKNKR
jgi:YidC/Oxa1 family membrane protein insertase